MSAGRSFGRCNVAEIISNQTGPEQAARSQSNDRPMVTGIFLTFLALSYVAASVHARSSPHGLVSATGHPFWFPLELFVIAILPATFGVIFLYCEKLPLSAATSRRLRSLVLFAAGLTMAAWFASVVQ
jgi:predicted metal-binding membrane protein